MRPLILLLLFTSWFVMATPWQTMAAEHDTSLGTFGHWRTFSSNQGGQRICYMALTTVSSKNKKFKRGASYLMITHRPSEAALDVVSYIAGYNFKSIDDVKIKVGKLDFSLFTQKDTAWTRDTRTDHTLTFAIRSNKSLSITGMPAQKKIGPITDILDLAGADNAYHAISHACGVEETPIKSSTKTPTKAKKSPSSSKF